MRILLLLIVLAVIGLTLARQISEKPRERPLRVSSAPTESSATTPTVPTRPQELKKFKQMLNRFIQDAATQRDRQADPP